MPTECITQSLDFGAVEGRNVEAEFDAGSVTSDAGALLLGATDRAIRRWTGLRCAFTMSGVRSEQGSSPRQRLQDPGQSRRLDVRPHQYSIAIGEHDLNLAARSRIGFFRSRLQRDRHRQDRYELFRFGGFDTELPTPGKELVGVEIVTPRPRQVTRHPRGSRRQSAASHQGSRIDAFAQAPLRQRPCRPTSAIVSVCIRNGHDHRATHARSIQPRAA
jgi:hypothetical protein